jgi:hypothetical protein
MSTVCAPHLPPWQALRPARARWFNTDLSDRNMDRIEARGIQSWHRALKDWPTGQFTPRLRVLLVRDCRSAGGVCACSAATRSLARSR